MVLILLLFVLTLLMIIAVSVFARKESPIQPAFHIHISTPRLGQLNSIAGFVDFPNSVSYIKEFKQNTAKINPKIKIFATLFSLLIVSSVFSATIKIIPTGTGDDSNLIQNALNGLKAGDTLLLNGDFRHKRTLYLPSDFTWILNGTLTLGDKAVLDKVGWVEPGIDARRSTGISETPGGATNIDMSGGTYYGNAASNSSSLRFLNFVSVTHSRFHDMVITQVSDDNFTLGPGCNNNECRNLFGSFSVSGNALTDKGDHNTWYDCIAADCGSDGWTPKCQYSTFIRCIAQNNVGPGFGMYAREEGYAGNVDVGAHIIGNQFIDCVSYGSKESDGFSFNISSNCPGAIIRDNFIQAVCYDNNTSGVGFRNKDDAEAGIIENNVVDIVCYGNKGLSKTGGALNTWAGGLGMENDGVPTHNVIENITGSVVCYDNRIDVNTRGGQNCNLTVYHPAEENIPILANTSSYNNTVNIIDFNCSQTLEKWCQQEYCKGLNYTSVNTFPAEPILFSWSQIHPNPVSSDASVEYTVPAKRFVSLKIFDMWGREVRILVNKKKQKGDYKIEFQRKGLPAGSYLYRIQIGDLSETKKFILK